jgi:hypothetical protein
MFYNEFAESQLLSCPGRSAARRFFSGVVRCRAGAVTKTVFGTVPALRNGMKNAAPRPGHEITAPHIT